MAKKESKNSPKKSISELSLPERIDTFNQVIVLASIQEKMDQAGPEVILDMTRTRFLSIPFIKSLAALAENAREKGKIMVLLNGTEKIKKQISIFSDLELFTVRRAFLKPEWPSHGVSADF